MTTRDKVAHLLRRFGLGATKEEVDTYEKLGYDQALTHLVMDGHRESPSVHPAEFYWREKEEADLGSWRTRAWWLYRMMVTQRPMQEKLALFWHNHFAVSDNKVEDGTMMLDYLQLLLEKGQGSFPDLLVAVASNPAMMKYLDLSRSLRGNPNENWAREVMELFTLGIGNYSETDVKEVARAFTGWGYVQTFWEMPGNADDKLRASLKYSRPFSSFAYMPAMHDPGEKTILGKTARFDGESVLTMLALHPVTARRICTKLWTFFAYPEPEKAVVDRLCSVFLSSRGDIRKVMLAIGRSPEFLSDRCVHGLVKSPLDFCIPIARQMGLGGVLESWRPASAQPTDRIAQQVLDQTAGIAWFMEQQGMALLFPPDVSGWHWNKAWASPDAMAHRFTYRGPLLWGDGGAGLCGKHVALAVKALAPSTPEETARALTRVFDIDLPESQQKLIADLWQPKEALEALYSGKEVWRLDRSMALLFASPEAHLN